MLSRTRYLAALQQTSTSVCSYSEAGISSGIDVLTEAHLIAADLEVYCDVLTRVSGTRREDPVAYEPTIVVGTSGIEKEHLVNLSFAGYVLGQLQNKIPAAGHIVTIEGKRQRANLQPLSKTVHTIVERIRSWSIIRPTTSSRPQQALSILPIQNGLCRAGRSRR